jgi:hypothetical protein
VAVNALALKVAPWLLLAWLLSVVGAWHLGHSNGVDDERQRVQAAQAKTLIDDLQRAAETTLEIFSVARDTAPAMAATRDHTTQTVKQVVRYVDRYPDFARVVRPAELERLRQDQRARIRAAAEAGSVRTGSPAGVPAAE